MSNPVPVSVSEVLARVPEGIPAELRRTRLAALLGLSVASLVGVPGAPILGSLLDYFNANSSAFRNVIVGFNEATPFNIDNTMAVAYRVWATRYALVHEFTPDVLLGVNVMRTATKDIVAADFDSLLITPADITTAIALIRTAL